MKIIKIASTLFPDRYKKYTTFEATYGFIATETGMLYLDPRYYTSAQAAGIAFEPISKMPRENCILDPFEWTISEIARFQFVNPRFEYYEDYDLEDGIELGSIEIIGDFLEANPGKQYLATNMSTIRKPTHALVFSEDGIITPLVDGANVLFDPDITPVAYASKLEVQNVSQNAIIDPIRAADAIITDIDNYKKFLLNDAIAWMNFWQKLVCGITEIDAANILESERKKIHGKSYEPAFETIAGNNENAAKIHGRATDKIIEDGVLLVDAGSKLGQHISDITRVFLFNIADEQTKVAYTNTLKAYIAVATANFAQTTPGKYLDELARKYVHFDHALGHAVGKTDVHAFPAIRSDTTAPLKRNMVLAIEPGIYVPGTFGIRLEGQMRVVENAQNFELEQLVFIPFEYDLVDETLLDENELAWLSKYHKICYNNLREYVDIEFLKQKVDRFIN